METLTLRQTGKRNPMPLVLVDNPQCSYWSHMVNLFAEELDAALVGTQEAVGELEQDALAYSGWA